MNSTDDFIYDEDSFDILKEIRYYVFFWPWFVLSLLFLFFGSYSYLRYSDMIYKTEATLQVKDAYSDPSSFLTETVTPMFNLGKDKN